MTRAGAENGAQDALRIELADHICLLAPMQAQVLGQGAGVAGVRAISLELAGDGAGRALQHAAMVPMRQLCWRRLAIVMIFTLELLVFQSACIRES
ncbi:hypothetical protein PQQ96_32720 [Paraburkholderia sediminicola]|uniref:hypothetical protein n=1 Tax=Paraburkholderia sediminicola TaxID=458836 RepID=UPI0038BC9459